VEQAAPIMRVAAAKRRTPQGASERSTRLCSPLATWRPARATHLLDVP
jgi:hypothetical protein